jgi:hypothetical protein
VSLLDDIEAKDFDVRKSKALCTPADVSGAGIDDAETHLHARMIAESARQPRHVRQRGLTLVNALGAFTVDTVRPDRLLVPAAKGLDAFPPPPDPSAHDVDRYKCYLAQSSSGAPKLPLGAAALHVAIANQFTTGRVLRLNEVTRICSAVDEEGLGRKHPAAHLVCYQAQSEKPLVGGDVEKAIGDLHVASEWGNEELDAQRSTYELCLASLAGG